jgi:hypothetical protein
MERSMAKNPNEMISEEVDMKFGKASTIHVLKHVIGLEGNLNHDRYTFDVVLETDHRVKIAISQSDWRQMNKMIEIECSPLGIERQRLN